MEDNIQKLMDRIIHAKICFEVYTKLNEECDGEKYSKIYNHILRVNLESLVTTLVSIFERKDKLYSIPSLLDNIQKEKLLDEQNAKESILRYFPQLKDGDIYQMIKNLRKNREIMPRDGLAKLKKMRNQLTAHLHRGSSITETASMDDIKKMLIFSYSICLFLYDEFGNAQFRDNISKETGFATKRLFADANASNS